MVAAADTTGAAGPVIDTVVAPKPSVSVVSPVEGATYAVGGAPNANFSCTAAANLALLPGTAGCGMQVDGGAVQASGAALPAGGDTFA